MARLIPRKQIEEQQNISGSFRVGEDINIGNNAIISGSIFVSQSFFLGNDTGSRSEITGSVFLTGSLTIDGILKTAAPNTILSVTSSNALVSVDTQRYAGILAKDFGSNLPTLYVSSTDGDDTNDGRSIQYPLRTIKRAAALSTPGYDGRYGFDTGSVFNGYVIKVQAGTYLEENPVILPKNTTIWGAGLRITKINAKNPTEDLFYVNSGCYIAEVTMGGLRLYPDQINPEKGFAIAFQPGAFITTSPYVQNCSQISNQENSFTELYEDIPPGGGGLYVNGDVIDPDSPLASMVLDAYTQISPNGVGCLVNGRGFIQLVSFFNNFSYYAIRVNNGGQATLNNSNISFGLYGMYSSGSRFISGSGGNIAARDSVRGTWSCVVDVLNKGLENGLPAITKLNTAEGIRLTAPSLYTQSRVSVGTTLSTTAADEISADYRLISEIVDKGVTNFPTLLAKSSIKGYGADSPYNILGAEQITSSISASAGDLTQISASYAALLSILANGTGSFNFKSNTSDSKQIGTDSIEPITNIATNYTASVSSSFGTVINIITKGVSVKPTYVANTSASIKGGTTEQKMLGVTSSLATINSVSASFSIVYNILANGTGSNILPIPANHQKSFVITNNNSSSFDFEGIGSNPTLTLFRGETYKFNIEAIETFGGIEYPFWIRTEQLEGITEKYDYNIGMVNNGDSRGTITFTVPYNAPNRLYYVSQNKSSMGGKIDIVNSSTTPFDLIKNNLTYPATIQSGSIAKTNIDIVTAYEILVNNIQFIQDEVIQFVSSSWSGFLYPEETCKRDVAYIVSGSAKDLLFGGNEESIRNGLFYYQYPSQATTTQLGPTLTAIKHAAEVSLNLIRGKVYVEPINDVVDVWNTIRDNKTFIQNEVITYLSSSWSNFYYNEAKCRRDTGYILDAVATDVKYGGNERSIIAGEYYYQYPSLAIVRGDGDGVGQLGQTSDGIRYASGLVDNLLKQKTFTAPAASTLSAYNNLLNNKELIQNETIQFINVAFPNLKYNQATCKRDVGYIVDNVATDLLYGGIERGVTAGRYYYDYPSIATTTQRTSTIAGVKYAKIIGDTIVQNQILDTPRIVYNDEKNFRASSLTNATSSFSGSVTQQTSIGNTFSIIEGIVARGLSSVKSLLAQNTGLIWNKYNPISVSSGSQITSSNVTSNEVNTIGRNFDIVNTIIGGGLVAEPLFTSSHTGLTKVTNGTQTTASFAVSGSATASLSSSFALITGIITDGVKSFTPTTATYNPADGNFVMTIPSHTLKTSNGIYLRPESFVFTCDMDGNRTEHKLPSAGQPAYTNRLKIQSVTNNTVTVNVGASGPNVQFTPTNATYNPANGDFVLTVGSHNLSIGEGIVITTGSIAFTCDMDNNQSVKSYPRFGIDPFAGRSMMITNTTGTTLTVNVGASGPNKYFTPTTASYNALTGDMSVTVGQHGLGVGRSVVLENNSIAFTCDQDGNATTHSYPRSGSDPYAEQSIVITSVGATQHTVTNAPYNAETGDVTLTIASHGFSNGDYVKIADNSLTYTCILDGNLVSKSYPRVGYDYPSGRWLEISNVTTNTFDINIGASSYTSAHTFVSATANGVERQNGIFTINVGDAGSASGSIHTFVSASANAIKHLPQSVHTFVSASANAIKHLPQSTHTFVRTNQNSVSTVPVLVQNTYGLIKVTNTIFTASSAATNAQSASISSSFGLVERVLKNGTSIIPALTSSLNANIKVTNASQYISSSYASGSDVNFISSSISIVTKIIEGGEFSAPAFQTYTNRVTSSNSVAAYEILKNNIPFIVSESIAYLSSSWSAASYDEDKCRRDLGFILSGSAEDLIWNANSASIFNGLFYWEFPSQAQGAQLQQTLDGINYASRLAQKVILNTPFVAPSSDVTKAKVLLRNNTQFIKDETIAYLSSSWIGHDYNETTCKRDVGHILDAAITDMVYGGNERSRVASYYYFTYPSAATGSQLMQTIDGINYANRLAQKTVLNSTFIQAENNKVNASNLIRLNRDLIANEVVEYVSSSWSDAPYDDIKCRRDVKYILDAVRTDLVYGGNERSKFAGEYYYEYPSKAIVAGVPSATAQLDSTITGIDYGSGLVQNIVKNNILSVPSAAITNAATLVRKNRAFLQQNTVDYANETYPNLEYIESKCYRDTGFIVDAVITDLVYGGNERSITAGRFYYLYPSQATGVQSEETIDSLNFTKGLTKLVAIGGKSIEDGFDIVANVIESGSNSAPSVVLNTADGIKATTALQITSSISVGTTDKSIISSSFGNIINIVSNGTGSIPTTIVKNTNKGVNVLGGTQITSSNTPADKEKVKVTTGFDTVIDIVANGTGSIPTIVTNVNSLIKRTTTNSYTTSSIISSTYLTASNNSFDIVLDIVENGTGSLPVLIKNTDSLVKITNTNQYTSSVIISSSLAKSISGSFDAIINILQNGTGSKPTTATYNPANGDFVITIPNHNYKASDFIYLKPESFVFTCEMDGNRTEHKLPSVGQRAYNNKLTIISVTPNTITVNVGASGPNVSFTPTAATYDPATGNFVLTVGPHTLSIGEGIVITTGSIAFTCDMDGNQSVKSYPRFGIDPYAGRSFKITNTTPTTLTVNAGISAVNKYFQPSAVNYNALTGDMDVTVGQHGLGVGRSVILASASIAFTCDQNGNATTHSYPRSGSDPYAGKSIEITSVGYTQHTITNAPYNAETGDVTITIASHGFSNGDYIKISDNSLVYTCILDDNLVSKSYPRAGYDYPSGRWLSISGVTTNTFNINVGPSSYTSAHTFISATSNGLQRQNGIFRINVGDAGSASGSIHTFVSASANAIQHLPQSVHTFVSASTGAVKHLPQAAHTFVRADKNAVTPIPIIITPNTGANIKVTDATQYLGGTPATQTEASAISASISIVTNIIANGIGSLPTVTLYTSSISSSNVVAAYTILKSNLDFIVSESIAYLSSSWSTASYDESKCRRDLAFILSGSAEDLIWNANSASVFNGKFYYEFPSQAQGAQLNQTLDGIKYASRLAQKLVLNTLFVTQSAQVQTAYTLLVNNKEFIKDEVIPYISSSWSTHQYIETTCKRDVGHIIDAVSTDLLYGGNERTVNAGVFYYQYPSDATGSQIQETVTGIEYARNLAFKILRGNTFVKVSQNKLQAKELIYNNREFIQNEVISYISASWSTASYNQTTCKRDVGHILDAVTTDIVYGGNERSINAGVFYYEYPSQATTSQLGPTLSGIKYAKDLTDKVLINSTFTSASNSNVSAYELIFNNKAFIQNETIAYLSSSWSAFSYNQTTCKRDIGYILDAVATDILYGGNERVAKAGEYYYLYPSLATVGNDGDTGGQLNQTLDGIKYAKGITEKIVANLLLQSPTTSELTGFNLLLDNKKFIQSESIAYLSSSWSGGDGFYYNETTCKRDIGHIIDAVRTDLVYGGNERSSKAGEYYYLYPSAAILTGSISPTAATQKGPTLDGIKYVAGTAENIIENKVLISPTGFTTSSVSLLRQNKLFIQNETVQYIDAFFPNLVYLRETCRRDVGYILDAVITDTFYGGNQRSVIAGQYYYLYPSLATKSTQVRETVAGVDYAKALAKAIVQNIKLNSPTLTTNTDGNIKVTNTTQYTSSLGATTIEVNQISSSFGLVTGIITDGVKSFTPTTATYNPANGDFVITIPSHTLTKYNSIYIKPESFVFTCDMDGNRTEHKLPSIGQYAYSNKLQIQSVTTNTITVNVGASGPNVEFTPTNATYNPATGDFVMTVGTHSLSIGEGILITTGSIAFTCDMDNNQSVKSYPRFGIDPYAGRSMMITNTTPTTLTVSVGASAANKYFTPSAANYNALTGDMSVTVGQHGLGVGRSVILATGSIAFTCDQDGNATTHSYPRSGSGDPYLGKSIEIKSVGYTQHTVTNAPYNAETGDVTITIASHGFSNGDYIKLSDNSLTYNCVLDDNVVSKSYPRAGYDYPSGRWLSISGVTTNTFNINIGASSYTNSHTFVTASINGVQRQNGIFTINVGNAGSASGSIHTFVSASANAIKHLPQSIHTFVSASAGAIKHLPQATHTFVRTNKNSISTLPVLVQNGDGLIKVTNTTQYSSSISASGAQLDIITSSFKHVADIIENGVAFVPDSLARNYNYGFELATPTLLHISSKEQTIGTGSYNLSTQIINVSSSYGTVVNVVKNGLSVLPTLVTNTSSSLKVTNANPVRQAISASSFDTNKIASGFDLILSVIENGTSVLPTIISNTSASIKVTNTPQLISGSAAGRLQGKLISSSLSLVIDVLLSNGTSSIGFRPSTYPIANSNAKINSAYNLLVSNSKFIVDETIAYMSSSWSGFEYTQSKCERDLTGILSGSAFDLLYGGNSASLFNGKFYFDFPSNATGSQLDQTITAIKYASGLAEKVVLNTVFITSSLEASASWNSLRENKGFIQSESIAYLSASWAKHDYNEITCKRDIGYIIDAVATDLLYGGNERSVIAGRYYYDYPSQATNAQLEPTLTGVRYAKGTAMNVVVNKQIFTASLEVQYAYDLIKANKLFIQSESVAYVNAKYPNLDYSESKCYRDLGYIIDGVATDLLYGGNERSRDNADYYYQFPSQANGFGSQVIQTTDAIKYAARFTTASISSTLIGAPSIILNTLGNIKVTNANQYISASSATSTEATIISASIAIVTNIVANGTGSAIVSASLSLPTSSYTTAVSNDNRWIAYGILKNNISFIQDETIAYLSSSWSTASYDESKCRRDVGLIISGAAEDLIFNSNSASLFNGIFYYQYPSQAQGAQLNQTLDGINYASKLAQKVIQNVTYVTASAVVSASYALIRKNREFIQNETIAYLSSSWSTASYIESTCKRDVGHIIDAVSTDLLYGGNERSTNAGVFYYLYPSQAQGSQLQPTLAGVNYAGQLSKNVAASLTFVTASQIVSASVNLLRKNREFIQTETLAYLTASWSTFEYDKDKCKRDVGYILDGVTTDLLYGGNERGVFSGEFYYKYPSKAIIEGDGDGVGQLGQTIDGINYASRIAQKIVKNIEFVTASVEVSASFDLLRKNKAFIAEETIAYVSSSWSGVYYNETTCKRDVGYLIDAAATDVLYGGQERSVIAGQYYYLYPSNAINSGVPSTQNQLDPTLTGIRYAGKLSKKVVINPTYLVPSASLLTTAKLLTDNKQLIQKETITFLSSSWSNLKYNEASCSRDLGFIIDAIRTDLVYGGNERSIEAGSYYYKFPSVAIVESYSDNNGQKKQTIDGINFARGISEKIVANTLLSYLAPATKRRQAAERLKAGKDELKQRAIGYTNGAFPYLVYNEASCSRDTGFIVDAAVTDLLYGGNERGIRAASSYYDGQYGSAIAVTRDQLLETLETNRYLRTRAEFIAAGAPLEAFGSLIVATGIDYSYNGSGVTFKALPPNQGGSGVANPIYEITELGGGRIFFTSGNQDGDFRIGTGLSINQATGTLVGRTFSKSLFSLVTPFSLALQI